MRVRSVAGFVAAVLVGGAAGAWAGDVLLQPAPDVLESPGFTVVEAADGSVGRSFRLNTAAEWESHLVASNLAAGTVTSVVHPSGEPAGPGDELFSVDLRPVVVAVGVVPAFRDLQQGDRGDDVAQLQALLVDLGHYAGEATGRFTAGVYWAVRAWQRDLGVAEDGVVRKGEVLFVHELPARLTLADEVAVGAVLAGGEPALHRLDDAPTFSISLPEGQAQIVRAGQLVDIDHEGGMWVSEITEISTEGEFATPVAILRSMAGGPICGDECATIALGDPVLLPSRVHVVPETSGVTVPSAAVVTDAGGNAGVINDSGEFVPVSVVESASGMAVVEGVEAGTRVRVPGDGS